MANSREHIIQQSDLKSLFGTPTQGDPIVFNSGLKKNKPLGSLKTPKDLKSEAGICHYCNTTRTQAYDISWQVFSTSLREKLSLLKAGQTIACNKIFLYDTSRGMRNIHLFFLKKFGCDIEASNIKAINIDGFSNAILNGRVHPNVFLSFGPTPNIPKQMAMRTNMQLVNGSDGLCAFAIWAYIVDNLTVHVMYALPTEKNRTGMINAWHPSGNNRKHLTMSNFYPP